MFSQEQSLIFPKQLPNYQLTFPKKSPYDFANLISPKGPLYNRGMSITKHARGNLYCIVCTTELKEPGSSYCKGCRSGLDRARRARQHEVVKAERARLAREVGAEISMEIGRTVSDEENVRAMMEVAYHPRTVTGRGWPIGVEGRCV